MDTHNIITELARNREVFHGLFANLSEEQYRWRPTPDKWNLLEVLCHLYDEEREDFRARTAYALSAAASMPPIDPEGWVEFRHYAEQDFTQMLHQFLAERQQSIAWLRSLDNPDWNSQAQHPELGPMSARQFLANWLAHDYLHIRQVVRYQFTYLQQHSGQPLSYAGDW